MLDILSRYPVGWRVEHHEDAEIDRRAWVAELTALHGRPGAVHADRGSSMTSKNVTIHSQRVVLSWLSTVGNGGDVRCLSRTAGCRGAMTTTFVLAGGASLGSIQAGMLVELADAGITPDQIVGTSVGAVNGGWVAAQPDTAGITELADMWRSLSRGDIFPIQLAEVLLGFLLQRRNLVSSSNLRRLLTRHLKFTRLEDAPIPLHVVATDVLSGKDVLLSSGDAVDAIMASSAIPTVLPPMRINGQYLMDGGTINNTPLSHAVALGADVVYVLPGSYACGLSAPPKGVMGMALHSLTVAINQRLSIDIARFEPTVDLRVIPPPCPIDVSPMDFSHADKLIKQARRNTAAWLAGPSATDQAELVAPHRH